MLARVLTFWRSQFPRPFSLTFGSPFWVSLSVSIVMLCPLTGCGTQILERSLNSTMTNPNILLGKPSAANRFNANDYLIDRPQYVMSYNRDKGIPNWVSWQLNQSWLGDLPRSPFTIDTTLPRDWKRISPDDYTGSGFDRGHVVPAADRNRTQADSKAVFLMTNILPQAPDNNRGPWEDLESYCRILVRQGKELYIVAGQTGVGGTGEKGKRTSIGKGSQDRQDKVTVPAYTWKVVVVLDRPDQGIAGITETTRVMAALVPNQQGIKEQSWREFRVSVDQIEQLTGYDLLASVPTSIQEVIEAKEGDR